MPTAAMFNQLHKKIIVQLDNVEYIYIYINHTYIHTMFNVYENGLPVWFTVVSTWIFLYRECNWITQWIRIKNISHPHLLVNVASAISLIAWVMKHSEGGIVLRLQCFHVICLMPGNPDGDNRILKLFVINVTGFPFQSSFNLLRPSDEYTRR